MMADVEKQVKQADEAEDREELQEIVDAELNATWGEVATACCTHTGEEWLMIFAGICLCLLFLLFFLVGLELLGNGAKVMTSCSAGALFGDETNPVASLMVGILVTVLLQSSSTTTSIVVSLVAAGTVAVSQGIYMIMGANIGTSVTSTIVAMASLGDGDQLERAFAGATVHDLFNFATVAVLFPIELIIGYLYRLTKAITNNSNPEDGESWDTPLSKLIDPIVKRILDDNSSIVKHVAKGGSCNDYYPIECENGIVSAKTCKVGLIACYKDANVCPVFFNPDATQAEDQTAGAVAFILAIMIMFTCLAGLVACLQKMLLGVSTRIIYKATDLNPYIAMLVGAGITMFVQSSSITTSALTPLVGVGVLRLEAMMPLTLGANVGTTMTALLAAMVSGSKDSLQVALAHLFFNITGIIIWYPIPFMRRIPLEGARTLGRLTRIWRGFPFLYIGVAFFLVPLFFFGLSALYMGSAGLTALAVFITIGVAIGLAYTFYWCYYQDGKQKTIDSFKARERHQAAVKNLPDDVDMLYAKIDYLTKKVSVLMDHTGAPEAEDEGEQVELLEKKADEAESDNQEILDEIQT